MNNRKNTKARRTQFVTEKPTRVFVEKYLTKTGYAKLFQAKTKKEKDEVWKKYSKNRYQIVPSRVINTIQHHA